jgi:2-phosphosulfolactate phosphatase
VFTSQDAFSVRFEWALAGVLGVANHSGAAVIVDVLSFSTCVEIATRRGATVLPYGERDAGAAGFAAAKRATLAVRRSEPGPSLSPGTLAALAPGSALVLPSPNGAVLSLACVAPVVLAGCLRNASAVARHAGVGGRDVCVIAAGERWPDGATRFALEDLVGAGAVIHALTGSKSPEAGAAESAFLACRRRIAAALAASASGRELCERGFPEDVALAAELDVSTCVPRLVEEAFVRVTA